MIFYTIAFWKDSTVHRVMTLTVGAKLGTLCSLDKWWGEQHQKKVVMSFHTNTGLGSPFRAGVRLFVGGENLDYYSAGWESKQISSLCLCKLYQWTLLFTEGDDNSVLQPLWLHPDNKYPTQLDMVSIRTPSAFVLKILLFWSWFPVLTRGRLCSPWGFSSGYRRSWEFCTLLWRRMPQCSCSTEDSPHCFQSPQQEK